MIDTMFDDFFAHSIKSLLDKNLLVDFLVFDNPTKLRLLVVPFDLSEHELDRIAFGVVGTIVNDWYSQFLRFFDDQF